MAAGGSATAAAATGLVQFGNMTVLEKRPKAKEELPRQDEARALLLKTAKQVEPIMKKRGWKVRKLIEIIPPSPNLLGWNQNKGAIIAIRLRRVNNDDSFFDFNHVLCTMLHELVHNEIGPHNAAFYALLDELWAEAEELMEKGVSGLGAFESTGHRSGGLLKSSAQMREAQVQAALKRRKIGNLMGGTSSGKRLGGSRVGKDIRALAAEAAERRAADDVWCSDMVGNNTDSTSSARLHAHPAVPFSMHANGAAAKPVATEKGKEAKAIGGVEEKGKREEGKVDTGRNEREGGTKEHAQLLRVEKQIDRTGGGVGRIKGGGQEDVVDLTMEEEADTTEDDDCVLVVAQSSASARQREEGGCDKGEVEMASRNAGDSNADDVVEIVETEGGEKRLGGRGASEGRGGGVGGGGRESGEMTGGANVITYGRGGDVFKAVCGRCAYVNAIRLTAVPFEEDPLCDSCGALL